MALSSGTVSWAVSENEVFLKMTTEFSVRRPMPENSSCRLPWMRVGRPAVSGRPRSTNRSSKGTTWYFTASMSHSRWSSCSLSGCWAARSWAWVQSVVVSYSSHTSSSKAGGFTCVPVSQGVRCLVTAVQPLWVIISLKVPCSDPSAEAPLSPMIT